MKTAAFCLLTVGLVGAIQVIVVNNCKGTIWPGVYGELDGKPSIPANGGFMLRENEKRILKVSERWRSARIWARTGCTGADGQLVCETGSCGPDVACNGRTGETPSSLAEISLAKDANDADYYDVSFVDGSNIPVTIYPIAETYNRTTRDEVDCGKAGMCTQDIKGLVAPELRYIVNGTVVGTYSACSKTNEDKYCCRNAYNNPNTCNSSYFPANYYNDLKKACPHVYFFAYDDQTSTFTCRGKRALSADYVVQFCTDNKVGL